MATVNYEVVYKLDGVESWLYFHSEEGKAKAAGEKHFKRVMRDSGWTKRAKLIRIRKLVKAIDPPLTKAQKDALRKGTRPKQSANARRTRGAGNPKAKPKKVSGTGESTSLSRLLEAGPPRAKVSKTKLPKNKRDSGKSRSRTTKST